jgi:HAD superfamily hydrolase (TIGR01459 family)
LLLFWYHNRPNLRDFPIELLMQILLFSFVKEVLVRNFEKIESGKNRGQLMVTTLSTYPSLENALNQNDYKVLFLDAFGVFWGGNVQGAFPGASQTMERLFNSGKIIGILSNSSQPSSAEIKKYASRGFRQGKQFHFLITSGDVAKNLFLKECFPFPTPNKKYMLFCPPHPQFASPSSLFEGSCFTETKDVEEADFIYISIPHISGKDQVEREAFRGMVEAFLPSNKWMVCANPDCYAIEGMSQPVVRQGTIAALYEELGGKVLYTGKPFLSIYLLAMEQLRSFSISSKEEILMIGDTPETDIRGAHNFGIRSALITQTGIMAERIAHKGESSLRGLKACDTPHFFIEKFSVC